MSGDGAVEFEFPKLGGEDLLTDAREGAAKLTVASRAGEEFPQNEDLPLAADDGQQPFHFAFDGFVVHRVGGHPKVPDCGGEEQGQLGPR